MRIVQWLPLWLRALFHRPDVEKDLDRELRFHLDRETELNIARGLTPDEARRAARVAFGGVEQTKEAVRDERRTFWLERIGQDLRFGWRQLRRAPAFTSAAVLTLALGIGATAAVFSVLYSVVLRPLPYANADRIVDFMEGNGPSSEMNLTFGAYADWRARSHSFIALGATAWGRYTLTGAGDPVSLSAIRASADYWRVMSAPPVIGRYYTADEDRIGGPPVAVLSYGLWSTRFANDPRIVGKTISLNSSPVTIIGVASPAYNLGRKDPQLFMPWNDMWSRTTDHGDHELQTYGLLKAGVTLQQAIADVSAIERANLRLNPHSGFDGSVVARFYRDEITDSAHALEVLFAAVACVLLIGCVNIANLLLSRGTARSTELAVRSAIGAGRGRVVLQLLNESLLLAGIGAVAGVGVTFLAVRLLVARVPAGMFLPRLSEASVNLPVLLFALVLALGCGVLFGLVPSLRVSRLDLQHVLRAGGRDGSGAHRDRLRNVLVVVEVGLAEALLVLAGLLIHSAVVTSKIDTGIGLENRTAAFISLPVARYKSDTAWRAAYAEIQSQVASIPGVQSTAYISTLPIASGGWDCTARPEGSSKGDASNVDANFRGATTGYFTTIGIPLLAGRDFAAGDVTGGAPVAIINQDMARKFFGNANPIGKRVTTCVGGSHDQPLWREVIGVVGNVRSGFDIREGTQNDLYMPMSQYVQPGMALVIRSALPDGELARALREKIQAVDPLLPIRTETLGDAFAQQTAPARFSAQLYTALAALALILAAVGIYGVIAYFVSQRTREIGIRMALGAHAGRVVRMIVRQGLTLAVIGLIVGLAGAFLGAKVLSGALYGVTPRDPAAFVGVSAVLLAVAVFATLIPARRATRIDPVLALRG